MNRLLARSHEGASALDSHARLTAKLPSQLRALLRDLAERMRVLLAGNLVGIYVYGSLTQHAFDSKRSDVDLVVVTRRDLSDRQFRNVAAWLTANSRTNAWTSRLQMSFLIRDEILRSNSRSCLYQFGRLKRSRSDGNPIIWKNILATGVILFGPRPGSFVPPIASDTLLRALKREVGYLRGELIEKRRSKWRDVAFYRAYAAMTLCRILYTLEKGSVVSKPRAARWAMQQLPDELRRLITCARESDAGKPRLVPLSLLRKFVAFTDARLRRAP